MSQAVRHARRAGRVVLKLYQEHEPRVLHAIAKMGVTCKEGCSHCCMLPATATVPEMVLVVDRLTRQPDWPKRKPALERELTRHLREFAGVDILNERSRVDFYTRQLPCVFLKEHRCDVYEVRPSVCRYHLVVSPPENCALGAANPSVARLDLHTLDHAVAVGGAKALGMLYGGPIALAFVLAAEQLGVALRIPSELVKRCMIVRMEVPRSRQA